MLTLAIDTSGDNASAALHENGTVIAERSLLTALTHSQIILPMACDILHDSEKELADVDLFAVATGPGSYTGLRIGVSVIRAMAFSLNKPCCAVSTLHALAQGCSPYSGKIIAAMKARGRLAYFATFSAACGITERLSPDEILSYEQALERISTSSDSCLLVGNAASALFDELSPELQESVQLAPTELFIPSAASIAVAAQRLPKISSDELQACYYEITKAEKDLLEKK